MYDYTELLQYLYLIFYHNKLYNPDNLYMLIADVVCDIFYIENWAFVLDIKIIIKTLFNVFKGEEKAY